MIKAMTFDADGVVITDNLHFSQQLERNFGISPARTEAFFTGVFQQCLTGGADLKQELAKYLKAWGWHGTVDELVAFWFQCEDHLNEELTKEIQRLRTKGIKCYLATNQEKYRTDYIANQMGCGVLFDGIFSSAQIGAKKPSLEFLKKVSESIKGIPLKEIMFWDDSRENIEAANSFGFNAHLFTTNDDFYTQIEELL